MTNKKLIWLVSCVFLLSFSSVPTQAAQGRGWRALVGAGAVVGAAVCAAESWRLGKREEREREGLRSGAIKANKITEKTTKTTQH